MVDVEAEELPNPGVSIRRLRDLRRYSGPGWGQDENGLDLESDRRAEDATDRAATLTDRPVGSFGRPEVVRLWLEHEARAASFELEELVATVRPGRVPQGEREAYDLLAKSIDHLRRQGVTLEAIGGSIRKSRQAAARLEQRGRLAREAAKL